jgi:hypothetical protein
MRDHFANPVSAEVPVQAQVHDAAAAAHRLASLGLAAEDFAFVLLGADAEARTWSQVAPPVMSGMARWGKTNELLRLRLLPRGWSQDNPQNLPRTISPSGDFAIVGTAGDGATGWPPGNPTTRYAKGVETARFIERNGQLAFDYGGLGGAGTLPWRMGPPDGAVTWLLLYNLTDSQIHAELSLPESISPTGYVDAWTERVILPVTELASPVASGRPALPGNAVDVAVERRGRRTG